MKTAQSGGSILSPLHRYPVIIGNIRIPMFFKFYQNPNKLTFSFKKDFQQTKTIGGYVFEHWGRQPINMHGEVLIKKSSSLSTFLGFNTKDAQFGLEDAMYSPELMTLQTLFNIDQRRIKSFLNEQVTDKLSEYLSYGVAGASILKNPITAAAGVASGVELVVRKNIKKESVKFKAPGPATLEGYADTLTDTIILYKGVIYSGFFTSLNYDEEGEKPFTNRVTFDFTVTYTTNDWIDTALTQTSWGSAIAGVFGAATSITTIASMLDDLFTGSGSDTNGHI